MENEFVIRNAYLKLTGEQLSSLPYFVSVGLHPWFVTTLSENECYDIVSELIQHPKVLAVGEIGIDKFIDIPLHTQIRYFEIQLDLAKALQKPVIVHSVRSYNELIPYLKKSKVPFIFHQFTGNLQQAKELLKYNCKLSFGKNLFEPKSETTFLELPVESFLLETDTANHINILDVYRKAAELKKIDPEELIKNQFDTFADVFKI